MKSRTPHIFIKIFGAALTLIFSACAAVGPSYQRPEQEVPVHWGEVAGNISVRSDANLSTWWTLFNDPVLNSLITRAVASNQDLLLAETRIREARAEAGMTASKASPRMSASGGYTHNRTGENTLTGEVDQDLFQTGFDAGWELDIFGGLRRASEAAAASIEASVEDKRDVLVSLVAEVARNYIDLRGIQQRIAITEENISTQEKTVDMVSRRFQAGFGNELAVFQAKNQLAMTMFQIPGLQSAEIRSMHQLALLLGRTPEALIAELAPEKLIPTIPPQVPVNLPSDLLRQRPDIRRAERQLAAATAEIGVATADLFPRFSLAALMGLETTTGLSNLVTSGSRFWSAGPKVQWSLFDGGRTRAGVEAADSRRDRAQIVYEKAVLTALVEVGNALVTFSREQETHRILKTAVAAGQRAVGLSKSQYTLGLVDFLNVLQSELALSQSQDQLVQSEERLSLDMISLFKALGGGWDPSCSDHTL
jgi:outer membrane protein, multidrug efflux system